ncbi:MAG: class II aldolase/adducin family protein [Deferribacterales bacterium]
MITDIIKYGKKIVYTGLATSFFGNISIKVDGHIFITKTGSILDELSENDIIKVNESKRSEFDKIASSELPVHRAIYNNTTAKAIIHAHNIYSIVIADKADGYISFESGEILPFLDKVPVVEGKSGSSELAMNVSNAMMLNDVVIVRGHGVFVSGIDLKNCYIKISALEYYAKLNYLKKNYYENIH